MAGRQQGDGWTALAQPAARSGACSPAALPHLSTTAPHLNPARTSFCSFWLMPAPLLPPVPWPMNALR